MTKIYTFLKTILTIGPKLLYLQKSLFYRKVLEFYPRHTEIPIIQTQKHDFLARMDVEDYNEKCFETLGVWGF